MLEEASGCCEGVSGCTEEASGYVHLPAPEKTNRDATNHEFSILIAPFEEIFGKISPNEARINTITNKQIKNSRIYRFNQIEN